MLNRHNKAGIFILLVGLTALASIAIFFQFIQNSVEQPAKLSSERLVTVEKGHTLIRVLNALERDEIIEQTLWLKLYLKLNKDALGIREGTYSLLPEMTLQQFIEDMVDGNVKTFSIQLIEGLTWKQWRAQIVEHPAIVNNLDESELVDELQLEGGKLEGWLLPDSYQIEYGTSATEFIRRLQQSMHSFLQEQWQQRPPTLPYETPYEVLIMASIIEKETGLASERPRIAAVFVNRLEQGMRLQTDPTVIYGLGDEFDGNLTRAHLRQRTDYNTYVINGLPPTPIAMPSKEAIIAALNPDLTSELFFVAKGDGSHHFSETYAEHNQAVRKYQLKIDD